MYNTGLIEKLKNNSHKRVHDFPSTEDCKHFVEGLYDFLFIKNIAGDRSEQTLVDNQQKLEVDFCNLLQTLPTEQGLKTEYCHNFFQALPGVYDLLVKDAEAIHAADPAANSFEEVLIAYPGFFATAVYRFSNLLYMQGLKTLSRFFTEYAHSKTGIDIHPGAQIGHSFAIDHGTGVVIGETSIIGNNVKLYQGVTLGALTVSKEKAQSKRHPTIQDNVVIYAGATILGGQTIIGSGSIIGGNVWLTYSVPINSVVYHKSEVHVKDNNPFPEPLNFVI